ncbi:MAG: efflux RND transporter periplasmic adaptor subunit [Geminicoccaceae bacterium]
MNSIWRRITIWGLLLAAVVAGILYAFWPQPVLVDIVTLAKGPMIVTVDEEGETRVKDIYVLSAPVTGRALRIESDLGDEVVARETIVARIEPIDPTFLDLRSKAQAEAAVDAAEASRALAEAELEEAEAELDFAATEVERARRLISNNTISRRTLDDAERAFKTRRAALARATSALRMRDFELAQAKAQLVSPTETLAMHGEHDACECVPITAPVSGRILSVVHESEGVVEAGHPLAEIGDPRDLEIVVDFLSPDAVQVRPGQRVIIEEWGGPSLNGRVRRLEPAGFTKTSALGIEEQRVNIIIDLEGPPEDWQLLSHGYRVEARIVLWEGDSVLKLPLTALFRDGDQWVVFVEEGGKAERRSVEIGQRTGLEAEIIGGLDEGEQVVLHPSDRVAEGVRIQARADDS